MKRLTIAAVGLALVVGIVLGAMLGNPFGASAEPDAPNPGHAWTELEDHGTSGGDYWLGTTVDQALELRVNGSRALRLEPTSGAPNVIGGIGNNVVTPGVVGATIGGGGAVGTANEVTDNYGTVGGGGDNQAGDAAGDLNDAYYATVGGGYWNQAGRVATVGGGNHNVATVFEATVAGGGLNTASGQSATVGGGGGNTASHQYATVGGGQLNMASGDWATVGGGESNTASMNWATVGGGDINAASANYDTVGGGKANVTGGGYATIGGGYNNDASGYLATVGGGDTNIASNDYATVGGGKLNTATEVHATVVGGFSGDATAWYATVLGGAHNSAGGSFAVASGRSSSAAGEYSFAAGRQAKANNQGCFVWGDSTEADLACDNDNRFLVRASGGVYLYTNSALTSGSRLLAGGNSWGSLSDRNVKANFEAVDGQDILERLAFVPVETWNLKSQDASIRHIGPMAQDFYAAFGVGEDERYITTMDADGVALAAIQGLYELSREKDARIQVLEQRLEDIERGVSGSSAASQPSSSSLPAGWLLVSALVVSGLAIVVVLGGLALMQRRVAAGRQ